MKKLRKIAVGITAVLTMLSVGMVAASATYYIEPDPMTIPNVKDTTWTYGNDYCRRKYDNSSVYVNNQNSYYSVSVTVKGRATQYGTDQPVSTATIVTENLLLGAGEKRLIRQYISELGYEYAHIYFGGIGGYGQWSPDSVGSYDLLN